MNLYHRRLVDPEHAIIVEVALLDPAVRYGDLAVQQCAQAEDHAALDLRGNGVRIDDETAVDRAQHAGDSHVTVGGDQDVGGGPARKLPNAD